MKKVWIALPLCEPTLSVNVATQLCVIMYYRQHSVVYLPQGGRLCSFGLGANGQLGIGTASNSPGPAVVKGPFVPAGQLSSGTDIGSWVIKHISSAGDQCFVVVTAPHVNISEAHSCSLSVVFLFCSHVIYCWFH